MHRHDDRSRIDEASLREKSGAALLAAGRELFGLDKVCVVSAFGAESAIILDMAARLDRDWPILFIDTGKHFPETLAYRDLLVERLRLRDVRSIGPARDGIVRDPNGDLHQTDPDACCGARKVTPLDVALRDFDAWITGRKRFQGGRRSSLVTVEREAGRIKLNPLAGWKPDAIDTYFETFALPRHPLWAQGYRSIGCSVCTAPASANDPRAGRWSGHEKTECGIHRQGDRAA